MNDQQNFDGPRLDIDTALDFLQKLRPDGPWAPAAIDPDSDAIFANTLTTVEDVRTWITAQSATGLNLYYHINPLRCAMDKKGTKKDIARIEFVQVDADPAKTETPAEAKDRYRAALSGGTVPPPTFIVDSGNGLQMLWRLETPVDATPANIADIEARSLALLLTLGAPRGTQNIDRIFRLPGTINLPNAKKRKEGRTVCASRLEASNDVVYPLNAFPIAEARQRAKAQPKSDGAKKEPPRELLDKLYLQGDQPGGYPSRSELELAFIMTALRKGFTEDQIVEWMLDQRFEGCSIYEHVQLNKGAPYAEAQVAKAREKLEKDEIEGKRIIQCEAGQLDVLWRKTESALFERNCPVYVRGKELVWPCWREEMEFDYKTGEYRPVLSLKIEPYNTPQLRDMVGHHAVAFLKYDAKKKRYVPTDPPNEIINTLLTTKHWRFDALRGVIAIPTMRPDGSILLEPGYDKRTAIYYKPNKAIVLPPIPERPTHADALEQLEILKGLLIEFRFADDDGNKGVSEAVALAGIMTVVLRGAFGPAPMFLVTAPESRSGKTYLVKLIGVIGTGHVPINTAGSGDPVEMEKRIETAGLAGRPIIHLNNLPDGMTIDSMALAQMSSEGDFSPRLLGAHKEGVVDCRASLRMGSISNWPQP
jgi:hypothetical protein